MAVDTGLGRRNAGRGGDLDRGVAVAAVDADAADVVLVGELNRLLEEGVGGGHEVGPLQGDDHPAEPEHGEEHADQTCAGPGIGALGKNLRHGLSTLRVDKTGGTVPRFRPRDYLVKIFSSAFYHIPHTHSTNPAAERAAI